MNQFKIFPIDSFTFVMRFLKSIWIGISCDKSLSVWFLFRNMVKLNPLNLLFPQLLRIMRHIKFKRRRLLPFLFFFLLPFQSRCEFLLAVVVKLGNMQIKSLVYLLILLPLFMVHIQWSKFETCTQSVRWRLTPRLCNLISPLRTLVLKLTQIYVILYHLHILTLCTMNHLRNLFHQLVFHTLLVCTLLVQIAIRYKEITLHR